MKSTIKLSIKLLVTMTILLGIVYPVTMTGIGKLFFSEKVNGQMIEKNGNVIGSKLLGQSFDSNKYLHGRPQIVSQLSPTSNAQEKIVRDRIQTRQIIEHRLDKVPSDLVLASGSGLDPEISLKAAKYQVPRIAKERQVTEEKVDDIINERIIGGGQFLISERRVNVLEVNLALDEISK